MQRHVWIGIGIALLSAIALVGSSSGLATVPTTAPATAPATQPSRVGQLDEGKILYRYPDDWKLDLLNSDQQRSTFLQTDGPGIMAIQVLPLNVRVDHTAGEMLCKQMKENHEKRKDPIVMNPTIEPDKRFALRIHEKYRAEGHLSDELHLYRIFGKRGCMVTVNAESEDVKIVASIHDAGEQMLLSATEKKEKKSGSSGSTLK